MPMLGRAFRKGEKVEKLQENESEVAKIDHGKAAEERERAKSAKGRL